MSRPQDDAKGQYAPSQADRKANGVDSAKPTVVNGSEDATVHNTPPGQKKSKSFDLNYDERDSNEGEFRG